MMYQADENDMKLCSIIDVGKVGYYYQKVSIGTLA